MQLKGPEIEKEMEITSPLTMDKAIIFTRLSEPLSAFQRVINKRGIQPKHIELIDKIERCEMLVKSISLKWSTDKHFYKNTDWHRWQWWRRQRRIWRRQTKSCRFSLKDTRFSLASMLLCVCARAFFVALSLECCKFNSTENKKCVNWFEWKMVTTSWLIGVFQCHTATFEIPSSTSSSSSSPSFFVSKENCHKMSTDKITQASKALHCDYNVADFNINCIKMSTCIQVHLPKYRVRRKRPRHFSLFKCNGATLCLFCSFVVVGIILWNYNKVGYHFIIVVACCPLAFERTH